MLLTLGDLQCLLSAFIPIPGFLLPEPCKTLLPLSSGFDSPACFLSCWFFFFLLNCLNFLLDVSAARHRCGGETGALEERVNKSQSFSPSI